MFNYIYHAIAISESNIFKISFIVSRVMGHIFEKLVFTFDNIFWICQVQIFNFSLKNMLLLHLSHIGLVFKSRFDMSCFKVKCLRTTNCPRKKRMKQFLKEELVLFKEKPNCNAAMQQVDNLVWMFQRNGRFGRWLGP